MLSTSENSHMPILAGEAAVMPPRRRVPIWVSFPIASLIGWGFFLAIVYVVFAVLGG